jgi:cell wall-associated NlpC family hydrolase
MDNEHVERARALVGCRFRPQGRDTATGLDCVGVIVTAFGLPVDAVRRDYRIRGLHRREIEAGLATWFRKVARTRVRPGDVLLMAVAPDQIHLAIRTGRGFVHADAGMRKVVETPGTPPWPIVGVWRRRVRGPNGERSWRH